jgi:hypothetical protein
MKCSVSAIMLKVWLPMRTYDQAFSFSALLLIINLKLLPFNLLINLTQKIDVVKFFSEAYNHTVK